MSDDAPAPAPRRFVTNAVSLAWIGVYVAWWALGQLRFDTGEALSYGMPSMEVLRRWGATIPWFVNDGEWHLLVTGAFLHASLLHLAFDVWVFRSLAGSMERLSGAARTWSIFLPGAAAAGLALVALNPEGRIPVFGGSGAVFAIVGANLVTGLRVGGDEGRSLVKSALFFAVVTCVIGYLMKAGVFVYVADGAALVTGAVLSALLGPARLPARTPPLTKFAALGLLAVAVTCAIPIAQSATVGPSAAQARSFVEDLEAAERRARSIWNDPRSTSDQQRADLGAMLDSVTSRPWLKEYPGRRALDAFVDSMRPIARGDVPDPDSRRRAILAAFEAFRSYDADLRVRAGEAPRSGSRWR